MASYYNQYVPKYSPNRYYQNGLGGNQFNTAQPQLDWGSQSLQAPTTIPQPTPQSTGGGFDAAGAVQAATGVAGMVGTGLAIANQDLGLDTSQQDVRLSATGQPVYNGFNYSQASNAKPQGASFQEGAASTLQGAGTGAQIGSMFGGPVGGAIGAGVGALTGLATSLFAGKKRRDRQREEKRKAMNVARAGQRQFNEMDQAFDQEQASMTGYRRRRDMTNRLYNLYSLPQTTAY